uniref:AH domain-containing protein n=1 Tax=Electrophorus electricus TaxID=8005 RepID=A0A4W4EI72_ELEEL
MNTDSGSKSCSAVNIFDRFVQSQDSSVVNKFQQKYWKTKQTLIKVTGKKEDQHVVASDADLDAKLEVFHSVQRTCMELLKVIEQYQRRICLLSQEENELGRFLRSQGSQDKSWAGKIMQATGKALCFSSQQRLALRVPLCRLYQEVETFRYRAISDTWLTVNRMEQSRTEYRGALLWMKDVSQELDPDTHKHMEKFRKVQAQVRFTKASFDKLKNDVCQKVDLLGASRCNLLSHVLTNYQTTLLHFWEKTSHTMAAIHESFKGCRPCNLSEPKVREQKKEERKNTRKSEVETNARAICARLCARECVCVYMCTAHVCSCTYVGSGPEEVLSSNSRQDKDSLTLLSEILGSSSLEEFSCEWREVFGEDEGGSAVLADTQAEEEKASFFLPSQLLDQTMNNLQSLSKTARDRSAWFNLFADLDPLTNPDTVGRTDEEHELLTA